MLRHQWPCGASLSKNPFFFFSFFFRNAINLCVCCQKHKVTPYRSWRQGRGKMPVLFSLLWSQTSCLFGTFPKASHWVAIGANWQISPNQSQNPLGLQKISVLKGVSHWDSMSAQPGPARGFTRGNWIINSETWSGKTRAKNIIYYFGCLLYSPLLLKVICS